MNHRQLSTSSIDGVLEPFELSSESWMSQGFQKLLLDGWLLEWYYDVTSRDGKQPQRRQWDRRWQLDFHTVHESLPIFRWYVVNMWQVDMCSVDITITSRLKERISHCQNWHRRNDVFLWNFQDDQDIWKHWSFSRATARSQASTTRWEETWQRGGSFLCSSWSSRIASPRNIL